MTHQIEACYLFVLSNLRNIYFKDVKGVNIVTKVQKKRNSSFFDIKLKPNGAQPAKFYTYS